MKTYSFKAYNIDRKKVSYIIEFNSLQDFHKYLIKNRLTLISYKLISLKYKISQENILIFTQNFKTLLESGLTLSIVLNILTNQEKNKQFSYIINNIREKILNGSNIYQAFSQYRNVFGDTYLNLLLAGEESGNLLKNLEKICENISLRDKIKKNIQEAIFYPIIVFIFTILLLIFMLTFVFPNFISLFQDTNTQLPLLTKIIMYLSKNIIFILLTISTLITLSIIILQKISLEKFQNFKLKLPFYGRIVKKNLYISFCQNFSIMNEAGINIIDILEILKKATTYIFLQKELQKIQFKIKIGSSIEDAFSSISIFNSNEIKIISIGEKSGKLNEAFSSIAFIMQKEFESYLFKLTTLLQPILLLFLGIVVGIIVLAIYLPIFNISEIII